MGSTLVLQPSWNVAPGWLPSSPIESGTAAFVAPPHTTIVTIAVTNAMRTLFVMHAWMRR